MYLHVLYYTIFFCTVRNQIISFIFFIILSLLRKNGYEIFNRYDKMNSLSLLYTVTYYQSNRRYIINGKKKSYRRTVRWTDCVINSSLYGVVSEGLSHPDTIEHVYGMVNGIEGFLNDRVLDFEEVLPGEKLEYLTYTRVLSRFLSLQTAGISRRSGLSGTFRNLRNLISAGSSILAAMIPWIPSVNFPATRQALAVLSA